MNAIYFFWDLLFLLMRSFWNTVKIVILEEEGVYYYFLVVLAVEYFLVFHKMQYPSWGMVLLMPALLEKKFVLLLIMVAVAVAF